MSLGQWLQENYPTPKPSFEALKEQYTQAFLEDYARIKPKSQYEFNENKRPETRGWQTVAAYHNTRSWRSLLKILGLPLYFDMKRDHCLDNSRSNHKERQQSVGGWRIDVRTETAWITRFLCCR